MDRAHRFKKKNNLTKKDPHDPSHTQAKGKSADPSRVMTNGRATAFCEQKIPPLMIPDHKRGSVLRFILGKPSILPEAEVERPPRMPDP